MPTIPYDQKMAELKRQEHDKSEAKRLRLSLAAYRLILSNPDPVSRAQSLAKPKPHRKGKARYIYVGGVPSYVKPHLAKGHVEFLIKLLAQLLANPVIQAQRI